jgi:N-acetylneuraminic acid mutarotase
VGSTVFVNRLDDRGRSTPSTLLAEIEDSIGSFSFETVLGSVQVVATGYYFSELTGQISDGMLTLKALYEVSDDTRQVAHVNILTHLINDRVLELIADGEPALDEAIEQAEDELVAALSDALVIPDLNAFSALSVYDSTSSQNNTLGNAYLLALSTGFYKYAETKAKEFGTATDAELTLALNRLSDDLADDGRLQSGPFIREFVTAIRNLSPATIAANLRSRSLVDYPQGLDVPDISVFLNLCAGNFDCAWRAGAPMPMRSSGHATAVHAGKVYVFGGMPSLSAGIPSSERKNGYEVDAYDPKANEWTSKHEMPDASLDDAAAHTIGDKIYVVMGSDIISNSPQDALYIYDPIADAWSTGAARPTTRAQFASAVVNGLLYIIGGWGEVADVGKSVEIYDPATDRWSSGAPLPAALAGAQACVFSDQIYVFGGSTLANVWGRSILTYNTTSNSWSAKSPMPNTRFKFACVVVDDAAYLVGGHAHDLTRVDAVERYDPLVETWSSPTRLHTPRYFLSAAVVGQQVITMGGVVRNGTREMSPVDVVEILDTGRLGPSGSANDLVAASQ